jgi:hypothetical protein
MREQTALLREFDNKEETITEPKERIRREDEFDPIVLDSFKLPERNWDALISDYNAVNKKKFPFSPLECKVIIEYVKRGIPAEFLFKSRGINKQRYINLVTSASDMEFALEQLAVKPKLEDNEFDQFQTLMRNPLRILISDIERAEGISDLVDWEKFNKESMRNTEILLTKMKAKFKDKFSEKESNQGAVNVQINVAGNWVEEL